MEPSWLRQRAINQVQNYDQKYKNACITPFETKGDFGFNNLALCDACVVEIGEEKYKRETNGGRLLKKPRPTQGCSADDDDDDDDDHDNDDDDKCRRLQQQLVAIKNGATRASQGQTGASAAGEGPHAARPGNEELRNRTGMKDVINTAESLKWKWGGHVVRMDHRRWTHRLTLWDPRIGRRRVGRQTTRWADFFKKKTEAHWTSSTRDRQPEDRDITYALFCSVLCIMEQVLFDEILILSVEENPHAYDKRRTSYKDEKMKENTWLSIAASLNTDHK
ncbi:hypothetical protein ANN_23237 [Periplaneta americana]|uniref:MADF domain-containing protein n=1 Tax=Periplaneta americana TaxID=6978 RepID=A0ABQ8SKJ1_PERAM|nr:hypothetical protein ANN_23237 [Periplaneta americana]